MPDLTGAFLELIRKTSTDLPPDVENALQAALQQEQPDSAAAGALRAILENVSLARAQSTPICQDTGTPIFFVQHPPGWSTAGLGKQIRSALVEATRKTYLRPNAVDSLSGVNSGNNLGGHYFPTLHFTEWDSAELRVDLILKGGGSENVSAQYSLPDNRLHAGRDLAGVRKVVLDAIFKAQGKGCAPGVIGVAIGGDRGSSFYGSKEALLRQLDEPNPDPQLRELEERLLTEANQLWIGPMGFGGKTTVLAVKITNMHRLPASFFVSVSYMCWAHRRRRMTVLADTISYA